MPALSLLSEFNVKLGRHKNWLQLGDQIHIVDWPWNVLYEEMWKSIGGFWAIGL